MSTCAAPVTASGRRWTAGRLAALAVAVPATLLIPVLLTPWIHGDGVLNYAYCRSLWIDGDLDFSNELEHYIASNHWRESVRIDPITARPENKLGIGSAVLWTPFFLTAHGFSKLLRRPADGYGPAYVFAISLGTVLYALAGLMLLSGALASRFGPGPAAAGTLAAWLGSPLVFYMYLHPSMSHGCSFFLCALLVWMVFRWRQRSRLYHCFLIGLTAGLLLATRFLSGIYFLLALAFLVETVGQSKSTQGRRLGRLSASLAATSAMCIGALIGILPQLASWRSIHGVWLAGPRGYELDQNLDLLNSPHFFDVLFSSWRGLFVWSPALLFGALGLALLVRRRRPLDSTLLVMVLLQAWIVGGWHLWFGGASYGQRFFIDSVPAFALGLSYLFYRLRSRIVRVVLVGLLAMSLAWSAGLAVQYVSGIIPREESVPLRRLVSNQVSRVPQWVTSHLHLLLTRRRSEEIR